MASEIDQVKGYITKIKNRLQSKQPFGVILVHKKPDGGDQMINLDMSEIRKIKMALVRINKNTGTLNEIPPQLDIKQHLKQGDKLALNIQIDEGQYYIMYPIDFSEMNDKEDGSFHFIIRSFQMAAAKSY